MEDIKVDGATSESSDVTNNGKKSKLPLGARIVSCICGAIAITVSVIGAILGAR